MDRSLPALIRYVLDHTNRGACCCGQCEDAPLNPQQQQPRDHTVDVGPFLVALRLGPEVLLATKEELLRLTKEHKGSFIDSLDPNDGWAHNIQDIGGWLGDQGLALMYMGLGALLGAFDLVVIPEIRLPLVGNIPPELKRIFTLMSVK